MVVKITKPEINLREKLTELSRKSTDTGIILDATIDATHKFGFDSSANNSGTQGGIIDLQGSYSYSTNAKIGSRSLDFGEAQTGYGNINGVNANNNGTASMGAWFYITRHNTAIRTYLVDFRAAATGAGYWLIDGNNTMTILRNSSVEWIFPFIPKFNQWEHLSIVGDNASNTISLYRNGVLFNRDQGSNLRFLSTTLVLGTYYNARGGSGQYFLNGKVDNFFLSNRAYSDGEIYRIYSAGVKY